MSTEALVAVAGNFAVIGMLPRIFFRRGRFNWRWCATALPFFVASALVVLAYAGVVRPLDTGLRSVLEPIAVALGMLSTSLIWFAVGSHRVRLALWHQDDDAPVEIVSWGAYRHVRHPFYSAFLLAFAAALAAAPSAGTLATLVAGAVGLTVSARREERRLLASPFGREYRAYMRSTGRFLPGLGRLA